MKERPILFSAPMVRAILAGNKTQTRRIAKDLIGFSGNGQPLRASGGFPAEYPCPYGQPGDQLWVRETFSHYERNDLLKKGDEIFYRADGQCIELEPWRPSIHMPRWASRIQLEITAVRIERLHDISEADATAEGTPHSLQYPSGRTAAENYAHLWECINGEGSWAVNPLVWVVEFKVIKGIAA